MRAGHLRVVPLTVSVQYLRRHLVIRLAVGLEVLHVRLGVDAVEVLRS